VSFAFLFYFSHFLPVLVNDFKFFS
jgi:hypothetical protein